VSSDEKDAAEAEGEGVDGAVLVDFCVVEMTRHVVFFAVVVYDGRFRVVLLVAAADCVVELIGSLAQLVYGLGKCGLHVGVFSGRPVVLVAHIGPSDLVVEEVREISLFQLLLLSFYLFCLAFLCFGLFAFLNLDVLLLFRIHFLPTVQIGPVRFPPILIQSMRSNIIDNLLRVELPDNIGSLRKGQFCDLIPTDKLILLRFKDDTEICGVILVQFEMLLKFLEGVEILILWFLDLFVLFAGRLSLHKFLL
jgi:hypothetical protein